MKLEFHGHDQRYVVEQSLMNLFPGELPVYAAIEPGDGSWAVVTCQEEADGRLTVTTDLAYGGGKNSAFFTTLLSGSDFDREGQRQHAVAACFYQAPWSSWRPRPPGGC